VRIEDIYLNDWLSSRDNEPAPPRDAECGQPNPGVHVGIMASGDQLVRASAHLLQAQERLNGARVPKTILAC
jgi:hypothetical protein